MPIRRVSPEEAKALVDGESYVYVDVRSVPEFEAGHPEGAYNVPLAHLGPAGMAPNPDFLAVMQSNFPKDSKLVVGCRSGGRSLQAATLLQSAGYTNVVDQRAGFEGAPGPSGGEPGWSRRNLPVSRQAPLDHSYEGLKGKSQ
jgi:rhodanese-related sulfurtransferase